MEFIRRLLQEEDGQGYLEYSVLIALVVIAVAVTGLFIGDAISNYMERVGESITGGTVEVMD